MEKRISHLVKSFDTPPVSLLIVDDEKTVLSSVAALFSSPLWSITTAATLGGARRALGRPAKPWHCWILDVALGEHENGLELLRIRPDFKFTIVLSGLQSMTISADAMKLGATTVLDKNPDNFDALYNQACLNAALAYLFTTVPDQYFSIFSHLASSVMTDIVQWTEKSCYS